MDDVIPLHEVASITDLWHDKPARAEGSWETLDGMCGILTEPDGYNKGRTYCLSASFPLQVVGQDGECATTEKDSCAIPRPGEQFASASHLMKALDALIHDAKKNVRGTSALARFRASRVLVRRIFWSLPFQSTVAFLLVANFCLNMLEAQMYGNLEDEFGKPTPTQEMLDVADAAFTTLFTAGLMSSRSHTESRAESM